MILVCTDKLWPVRIQLSLYEYNSDLYEYNSDLYEYNSDLYEYNSDL